MTKEIKDIEIIYLHPGEVYYTDKDSIVSTVLGSCVTVTMHHKKTKISAISHCQLPHCKKECGDCMNCKDPNKYVDCTIQCMLGFFKTKGIKSKELEVKVFGGADVLKTSGVKETIGSQNIKSAQETLKRNRIVTSASDTGGVVGRKLIFVTSTGEIFLNKLNK